MAAAFIESAAAVQAAQVAAGTKTLAEAELFMKIATPVIAGSTWGAAAGVEKTTSEVVTKGELPSAKDLGTSVALSVGLSVLGALEFELVRHSANAYVHASTVSGIISPHHIAYTAGELTKVKLSLLAAGVSQ